MTFVVSVFVCFVVVVVVVISGFFMSLPGSFCFRGLVLIL